MNNLKCEGLVLTTDTILKAITEDDTSAIDPNGKGLFPDDDWFETYGVTKPTDVASSNKACQLGAFIQDVSTDYCCALMMFDLKNRITTTLTKDTLDFTGFESKSDDEK